MAIRIRRDITIDQLKEDRVQELKARSKEEICKSFISASTGHTFEFAEHDQMNFNQQISILVLDPTVTTVPWSTLDAGVIEFTKQQFIQIVHEAEDHKRSIIHHYRIKKIEVLNAETEQELMQVEW